MQKLIGAKLISAPWFLNTATVMDSTTVRIVAMTVPVAAARNPASVRCGLGETTAPIADANRIIADANHILKRCFALYHNSIHF
jgi:uncharacterized protein (DUF1786 family)